MAVVRKILLAVAALAVLLFGVVLAVNNAEPIPVDIGLTRFDSVPAALALVTAFAAGWVFGLGCAAIALLRLATQRRRLRRELESMQAARRGAGVPALGDAD